MSNVIRIKRTTTSNRPSSLANSELAMIEGSQTLVVGIGTGGAGGSATSIVDVGGVGAFLGLSSSLTQTAAGNYTFTGTVSLGAATATTPDVGDDSTKVATTAWVKDQGYLTSEAYTGTATSVGLSLPDLFSVSGSPVTSSGTLSATLATQTANAVFAGPTTGSAAAPGFRSLVAADIPDLSGTYLTTTTASTTYAPINSPTFTGTPASVTPASNDDSTAIATTAYVKAQNYITGNQTVALSGDATGSGTTAITVTIANDAVTNSKLANMATGTLKGRATASTGDPEDLTASDVKTLLAIVHTDLSDFDSGVQANRLDQMAAPTSAVSMNSQKLTNVATPTDANDAANKAYVDAARSGLDVKQSVRAATTANITLSGEQTIDGVSVAAGDRVLVKNQSTGSENGIYVCAAGAWSRATDADVDAEVTPGLFTFVEEGTVAADSGWVLTTNGAITVGTTSLAFAQFSGTGSITAGNGLTKTGSTLDVVGTANRITVAADSIDIASTYAGQNTIVTVGTITTGVWNGTTIAVANGGTGATDAETARSNLGLAIGTNVQAYDAELAALAGLTSAADKVPYFTGAGAASVTDFTSFGRSLVDDVDAAAGRTTLGLGTMATQAASNVAITGGTIDGMTIDGGTYS
jgi:hypothetical protein